MGKIYKNQSSLRIQLTTDVDITGATCKIKYRKPSGTTGEWNAVISSAADGIIYYDVVDGNIIDESGAWTIWAAITFTDLRTAPGEAVTMSVHNEGIL